MSGQDPGADEQPVGAAVPRQPSARCLTVIKPHRGTGRVSRAPGAQARSVRPLLGQGCWSAGLVPLPRLREDRSLLSRAGGRALAREPPGSRGLYVQAPVMRWGRARGGRFSPTGLPGRIRRRRVWTGMQGEGRREGGEWGARCRAGGQGAAVCPVSHRPPRRLGREHRGQSAAGLSRQSPTRAHASHRRPALEPRCCGAAIRGRMRSARVGRRCPAACRDDACHPARVTCWRRRSARISSGCGMGRSACVARGASA